MSEDTAGALGGSRLDEAEIAERKRLHQTAWKNLLLEQKLERMREFMKELDRSAQYQVQRIQELASHLSALDEHAHVDGRVVVPIVGAHRDRGYGATAEQKKVEGWF